MMREKDVQDAVSENKVVFDRCGSPIIKHVGTISERFYHLLSKEHQKRLKENPPKIIHGEPGKPFSRSPRVGGKLPSSEFDEDVDRWNYEEETGTED
jgi:hypothetical protein